MKQLLKRTIWGRLDQYLCSTYPVIWRTQIHWALMISAVTIPLFYGIGNSSLIDIRLGRIPNSNSFVQLFWWLQAGTLSALAYWMYVQFRINMPRRDLKSWLVTLVLNGAVFGLFQLNQHALQVPIYDKLAEARPDALFEEEWQLLVDHNQLNLPFILSLDYQETSARWFKVGTSYGYVLQEVSLRLVDSDDFYLRGLPPFQRDLPHYLLNFVPHESQEKLDGYYDYFIQDQLRSDMLAIHYGKSYQLGEGLMAAQQQMIWLEFLPFFLLAMLLINFLGLAPAARRPQASWLLPGKWLSHIHQWNQRHFASKDAIYARVAPGRWRVPMHYVRRYVLLPAALFTLLGSALIWYVQPSHLIDTQNFDDIVIPWVIGGMGLLGVFVLSGTLWIWGRRPLGIHLRPKHTLWQQLRGSILISIVLAIPFVLFIYVFESRLGTLVDEAELDRYEEAFAKGTWFRLTSEWDKEVSSYQSYHRYAPKEILDAKLWGIFEQAPDIESWQQLARAYGYDEVNITVMHLDDEENPYRQGLAAYFSPSLDESYHNNYMRLENEPFMQRIEFLEMESESPRRDALLKNGLPTHLYHFSFEHKGKGYNLQTTYNQWDQIHDARERKMDYRDQVFEPLTILFIVFTILALFWHHLQLNFRLLGRQAGISGIVGLVVLGFCYILSNIIIHDDAIFEVGLPIGYILVFLILLVMKSDRKAHGRIGKGFLATCFLAIPVGAMILGVYILEDLPMYDWHFWESILKGVIISGALYMLYTYIALQSIHRIYAWPKRR